MFPAQYLKSVGQNFSKCTYYAQWILLLATLSPQHISRVRATIRQKVDFLIWIPYTSSDRIWSTRPMNNTWNWFVLPPESTPQCPLIAINPNTSMHGHHIQYFSFAQNKTLFLHALTGRCIQLRRQGRQEWACHFHFLVLDHITDLQKVWGQRY